MMTAEQVQACARCAEPTRDSLLCDGCTDEVTVNLTHFVLGRLADGYQSAGIVRQLVEEGMPVANAERLVYPIATQASASVDATARPVPDPTVRAAAANDFLWGGIWTVIGLAITGITYAAADPGGSFLIFWGPAAYGGFRIVRGLVRYISA